MSRESVWIVNGVSGYQRRVFDNPRIAKSYIEGFVNTVQVALIATRYVLWDWATSERARARREALDEAVKIAETLVLSPDDGEDRVREAASETAYEIAMRIAELRDRQP